MSTKATKATGPTTAEPKAYAVSATSRTKAVAVLAAEGTLATKADAWLATLGVLGTDGRWQDGASLPMGSRRLASLTVAAIRTKDGGKVWAGHESQAAPAGTPMEQDEALYWRHVRSLDVALRDAMERAGYVGKPRAASTSRTASQTATAAAKRAAKAPATPAAKAGSTKAPAAPVAPTSATPATPAAPATVAAPTVAAPVAPAPGATLTAKAVAQYLAKRAKAAEFPPALVALCREYVRLADLATPADGASTKAPALVSVPA
jgi:hypothetical protein